MLHQTGTRYIVRHVAVNMGHNILVFGYDMLDNTTSKQIDAIFTYNLYTNQWRRHGIPQGQEAPVAVVCACAASIGLHLYMFGGCLLREGQPMTNSLWKLTTDSQGSFVWSEIVTLDNKKAPSPRNGQSGWEYEIETMDFCRVWSFAQWISE